MVEVSNNSCRLRRIAISDFLLRKLPSYFLKPLSHVASARYGFKLSNNT